MFFGDHTENEILRIYAKQIKGSLNFSNERILMLVEWSDAHKDTYEYASELVGSDAFYQYIFSLAKKDPESAKRLLDMELSIALNSARQAENEQRVQSIQMTWKNLIHEMTD